MKIGLAACAAFLMATPALAAPGADPLSAESSVLNLRGIDLTSVEGQQRLAIRMDRVADTVCGQGMSSVHLALAAQARECRADVLSDMRSRVAAAASAARESGGATQLAMR
ncbi:UrcA family protein [Sphingomonas citri]